MQSDRYKTATPSYHLSLLKLLTSLWIQTCLVQGINISRLGRDSMFFLPVYCRRSWIVMKMKRRTRTWSENTCDAYNLIYYPTLDFTNLLLQRWADFCYINPFHFWPVQSYVLWGLYSWCHLQTKQVYITNVFIGLVKIFDELMHVFTSTS